MCEDVNIIDELRQRNINNFLLGNDADGQVDGTFLSIDFDNAYMSMYLRWFKLVMKALGFHSPLWIGSGQCMRILVLQLF